MNTNKPKVVILSGAGLDQESGIKTFRSEDGTWANFKIEEVCTASAWNKDPTKVNDFYNMRRIEMLNAQPNEAHTFIASMEEQYDIKHVTQNVSDLLERAGNTSVLHLHGELLKARSSDYTAIPSNPVDDFEYSPYPTVTVGREGISPFQEAEDGFLLRPDIVMFGETVPNLERAISLVKQAEYLIVVGTSLAVYPAASLVYDKSETCKMIVVDPEATEEEGCYSIKAKATVGMPLAFEYIKQQEELKHASN